MEAGMNGRMAEENEFETTIGIQTFLMVLLAMTVGTLAAVVALPAWLPNLANSLTGSDPKAFWYLARGSSFAALTLMWLSMALGLLITNKMARLWPGAPAAFAIHEYVSLLGLAFAIFHALVLLGDRYINFSPFQILVPFTAVSYKPLLVGFGQLGFYIWLLVALSFYARPKIGPKAWRAIHYLSFFTYLMAFYHGLASGTDSSALGVQIYYWVSGGSLLFLLVYRIAVTITAKMEKRAPRPAPAAQ
jgi:predicted ferric reductase